MIWVHLASKSFTIFILEFSLPKFVAFDEGFICHDYESTEEYLPAAYQRSLVKANFVESTVSVHPILCLYQPYLEILLYIIIRHPCQHL